MTYSIKILGPGCKKCKTLTKLTAEVVLENNIKANIEKIEDMIKIMEYDVMSTPALVVNNKVLIKGQVPSKEEILKLITSEKESTNNSSTNCCCGANK